MEIMIRYVVLTASVILFVLVTSGNGDTNANGTVGAVSANVSKEGNETGKHLNLFSIIPAVLENAKSANLFNFLPDPIQSFASLVREIFCTFEKLGPNLPKLLFHPISLIISILPYIVALALIGLTFVPYLVLPCKIIALFLSILGLFSEYWAPFDKNYLAGL
jgi:hypothetical protein